MSEFVTITREEYLAMWALLLSGTEHIVKISESIAELGWRIVRVEARDKALEALEAQILDEIKSPDDNERLH